MARSAFPVLLLAVFASSACEQEHEFIDLAGSDGQLRFNLEFTNEANVDLDLHVTTPDGSEIYYANKLAAGGQLDVDCFCGLDNCAQGPNENIFWEYGGSGAVAGTYAVSVQYYGACATAIESSEYTLRVLQSGELMAEYMGVLGYLETADYTHVYGAPVE